MLEVILPFPDSRLNPNNSKGHHWAKTSQLRADARGGAFILAKLALRKTGALELAGDIALTITFVQPDRRRRDRDNLLSACKPMLDGLADALGVNDTQFEPITISRKFGGKPGSVVVKIGVVHE